MWVARTLVIDQNAQYQRSFYFYDADAAGLYLRQGGDNNLVPHDFTGATLKMQVRQTQQATSTLLDTYSTGTGELVLVGAGVQNWADRYGVVMPNPPPIPAYNNGFQLTITGPRAAAIASGIYYYDVLATVAGIPDYPMGGRFEVVARQTR